MIHIRNFMITNKNAKLVCFNDTNFAFNYNFLF